MNVRKLFLVITLVAGLTACSAETVETSSDLGDKKPNLTASKVDYNKKFEIIERIKSPETALSILIQKMEFEWPTLFTMKTEEDLLQRYSFITWHIDSEAKNYLQENLSTLHPEYQEYLKLLKEGVLPAQEYTVTNISVDEYNSENVTVTAQYELLLSNGQKKNMKVSMTADTNFRNFNQRFNTSEGELLPDPVNKEQDNFQDFIFSVLTTDEIRKLTLEELFTLFEH
ncbi:hypothetical protein NDK47_07365 [Brevibacillus ruminantium]|uniref:Uncharacterized protein n=1 Tax=Brevibacillus ruminantium TaxID=2950604 RepID=A0ABY4WJ16_9BACL|nr:hypothetical protein [Brevibacillus ruminantium]USG67102.1 hypothetical protein NDK47_07365 [Brevibacillus ruminantium]